MAAEFKIGRLRYTWRGAWQTATFYNRDAVSSFDGKTYVCLIPHTSSQFYSDYTYVDPVAGNAPRWTLMLDGTAWKGEWQPLTNYTLGNIVLYGGSIYKRIVNAPSGPTFNPANWEIYIGVNSNWTGDWVSATTYTLGDIVKYGGITYKCKLQHTSALLLETDILKWDILELGIEFKGTWDPDAVRYKTNDVVKYGPDLWIANSGHLSALPFDATADISNTLTAWRLWLPGPEYTGTWNSATVYALGEVVKYGGYSYINLIVNNSNIVPVTLGGNWEVVTTGYSFQNDWVIATSYKIGSLVRRGGNLYEAIQDNSAQDPSVANISVTYTALGSSGTTLVVDDTTGIVPGMIISGNGFELGQYVVNVVDGETLTISAAPYATIVDNDALLLSGVNGAYWKILTPGVRWRNRWIAATTYVVGDIAKWNNATYRCITTNLSTVLNRPDLNVDKDIWVLYLPHDQYNVLNLSGEMVVNTSGVNEALPIGPEGFLLKSVTGTPTWSNVFQTPAVYYVAPSGTDEITSGATWDNPYKSIKYACDRVAEGLYNATAKQRLFLNKDFLVEEALQWQIYQVNEDNLPFVQGSPPDADKTRRDVRYLIDAIMFDLSRNSNSQTIAYVLAYFDKQFDNKFITPEVAAQIDEFIATLNYLFDIIISVLDGTEITPTYIQINNSFPPFTQVTGISVDVLVLNAVNNFRSIVIDTLTAGNTTNVPPENQGLTSTIFVKTGTYYEEMPIILPANTVLVGDELRGTAVYPKVTINTLVTRTTAGTNLFTVATTVGMTAGTPVQFVSLNPVDEKTTIFGAVQGGSTYYIVGTPTATQIQVSPNIGGTPLTLTNNIGVMRIYGGDALKDMFYVQNATGIRNMTLFGLLGTLTDVNSYNTRRPTGGSFVSFDPGTGPDDTTTWIVRRSPYIQNVTTFGTGCVGMKVDGTLHNGGNKSMVANDFTQILSDGIGAWITGPDSLSELVSVFSYYNYAGYFAEDGGRIRATNGNSSYGTFGVIAEGFDNNETPIIGNINNRYYEATATPLSSLGSEAEILKLQYSHAGEQYIAATTNMLTYSNTFTSWTTDGNITLIQSIVSPFGQSNAWLAIGNSSATDSSFFYQDVNITPSGAQYTEVSGTNITGSGTLATFNVTVTSTAYLVVIFNGGTGYVATNKIRILGSQLGGLDGTNDLVITVTGLVGTTISAIDVDPTLDYPNLVQIGSTQPYVFSVYCKKGTSTIFDVIATFSGFSTASSQITFNFNTLVVTPSAATGGYVPITYAAVPVSGAEGWYRLYFTFNDVSALNTSLRLKIYPRSQFGNTGYTSLYGAQLEIGNTLGFYLDTDVGRYTAYANYEIVGAGTGVKVIGEEIRSNSVYQTRLLEVDGVIGGDNYLLSTNNAQTGDDKSIVIAASDVAGEKDYLGMRLFVNSGTGAGQYGTISYFDVASKTASIVMENFKLMGITTTETSADTFSLDSTADVNLLYVGQVVQFVPTSFTSAVTKVSQSSIDVTATVGGLVNTLTVSSTVRLTLDMPVSFSGSTFGGVTSNFTYYVLAIIDEFTIQLSTAVGGAAVFLTTVEAGVMILNYPNGTSYLQGPTSNMDVNLPIHFTGNTLSSVVAGTTYFINEIFGTGNFTISSLLITPTATNTTAVSNTVTLSDTTGLVSLNPIIFTGTTFGNITPTTKYYINHVVDLTRITLAASITSTTITSTKSVSNLITVASTTGFIIGNPIIFTGTTFGGIANEQRYFILYVANSTKFTISNTSTALSLTVTETTVSTDPTRPNQLTVNSSNNVVMLNPITFSGTTLGGLLPGVEYYVNRINDATHITVSPSIISVTATETADVSNLITVTDTAGFEAGNPIIFSGDTFGGIVSGTVYYVSAINDGTTLTVSSTPGGSAFSLIPGTGVVTARTTSENVSLTAGTGSFVGTTRASGTPVTLTTATGSCITRTTGASITLSTAAGTLAGTTTSAKEQLATDFGTMNGIFEVPLLGGISLGTSYYITSVVPGTPNKFSISAVSAVGPTLNLTNSAGSMQMGESGWDHVNPGTPLVPSFDASTTYSIEPRIVYSSPAYSTAVGTILSQAPGTSYVGISYGKDRFAAIPNSGNIIVYSTNGSVWTQVTLPTSRTWSSIAYGNNYWVIISQQGSAPGSTVLYSNSNLATWKSSNLPALRNWSKVVYGNGRFIAITTDSNATAISTTNGASWIAGGLLSGIAWRSIAYGNNRFVVIASSGTAAAYSSTGASWTAAVLPTSTTWSGVAYGNGRFVAIASTTGKAAYSLDGITWVSSPYNVNGTSLTYGNGVFVATGHEPTPVTPTAYTSEDGILWTVRSSRIDMGQVAFGLSDSADAIFVSVKGQNSSNIIEAGSTPKARPVVSDGSIISINQWDPGSNYLIAPTVTIADSNATLVASTLPLVGDGVLANPTFLNRGVGYNTNTTTINITGLGYASNFQTGSSLIIDNLDKLPSAGDNLAIIDNTVIYKVTSAVLLDGTVAPDIRAIVNIDPPMTVGLSPAHASAVNIRTKYSQVRLTNHDLLNIGFGNFEQSNYPRLPETTVLSPQNEAIENNYGRVFYSSTDQDGNFRVGKLFAVEQATGIVTLSASQFGLSGLTELKIGGVAVGGNSVIITQFSTDSTFVANSNQIIPTQRAIKSYLSSRLSQGGSNTFTGKLIAGTVEVGGPDVITSTVPEGNDGSVVNMPTLTNIRGIGDGADAGYGGWDGDGMAFSFFMKSIAVR